METVIVLLSVDQYSRETAEQIENLHIRGKSELRTKISELTNKNFNDVKFSLIRLSDFTTLCNDQDFNPELFWLSYVNLQSIEKTY